MYLEEQNMLLRVGDWFELLFCLQMSRAYHRNAVDTLIRRGLSGNIAKAAALRSGSTGEIENCVFVVIADIKMKHLGTIWVASTHSYVVDRYGIISKPRVNFNVRSASYRGNRA